MAWLDDMWIEDTTELSDGEVSWGFVRDGDSPRWKIQLKLKRADGSAHTIRIPDSWHGNFGGSELVVTPDESHAVVFVFSGQDEAECMIFRLVPELEFMGAMPVSLEPVCSPDARFVAGLEAGRGFAIDDKNREFFDPPAVEEPVFELARLHVYDLTTGGRQSHPVWLTFRSEELEELKDETGLLEEWAENLYYPELGLGHHGQGTVFAPIGRFTFTVPDPAAATVVLATTCTEVGDSSAIFQLSARS